MKGDQATLRFKREDRLNEVAGSSVGTCAGAGNLRIGNFVIHHHGDVEQSAVAPYV